MAKILRVKGILTVGGVWVGELHNAKGTKEGIPLI